MSKIIKYTTVVPFTYLFNWDNIKYMSVISDDKQAQADLIQLLDKYKFWFEDQLKLYIDNQEKTKFINEEIDKYQKWLITRQGLVYLLDGRFDSLFDAASNVVDIHEFQSRDKRLRITYEKLKKAMDNFPFFELNYTIDEEKPSISVFVKSTGDFKIVKTLSALYYFYKFINLQEQEGEKIEFPSEVSDISKGIFSGLIGRANATQLIYKPLINTQLRREYLLYLIEKRNKITQTSEDSPIFPNWLNASEESIRDNDIQIKKEFISYILGKLSPYFSQKDLQILSDIFHNKNRHENTRVLFNDNGRKIGYFFWELHNNGIVIKKKQITELFFINHIDYISQKTKNSTAFSKDMAHKYLSKPDTLKGKDTIDLSDLNEFIENNYKKEQNNII